MQEASGQPRQGVLIETLWNVKEMELLVNRCANIVLIETLWNVKNSTPVHKAKLVLPY